MPAKSISAEILECLESLRQEDFDRFIFWLKDRSEEPRIRGSKVDRKSPVVVTEVMVSAFTKTGALTVTLEILRGMRCNEEADDLESRTHVLQDNGDPTFRRTANGNLEIIRSQEARDVSSRLQMLRSSKPPAKKPEELEAEAKKMVKSEGGDPSNTRLVLSRFTIQFGQYRGQTFKWLLENDGDYVALILAQHRKEREDGYKNQNPLMANKDSLAVYAASYPDFEKLITLHYDGQALMGFGKFPDITRQDLYDSTDKEKVSYVNFLREMEHSCIPRSKMDVAVRYVLRRDQERPAAVYKLSTGGPQPSGPKQPTKRKNGGEFRNVSPKRSTEWYW